jgi:hypothetical protein
MITKLGLLSLAKENPAVINSVANKNLRMPQGLPF